MSTSPEHFSDTQDLSPLGVRPDDLTPFRLGRLLLLLSVTDVPNKRSQLDLDRLCFYDFFSANRFLVFGKADEERRELILAGFQSQNLSYQSSAQRFTNRRARIQHDLSLLIALDAAVAELSGGKITYLITARGRNVAAQFHGTYARAYERSARIVTRYLNRLSDTKLQENAKIWLKAEALLIDIYDIDRLPS